MRFWSYLTQFFLEWEKFQTNVAEKIKTLFTFNTPPPTWKSCRLWDNVEKFGRAGQATGDSMRMRISRWVPKATLIMCSIYCFSTATIVARMPLIITLNVPCLPCYAAVWAVSVFLPFLQWKSNMKLSNDVTVVLHATSEIFMGHCFAWFYMIHIIVLRPTIIRCAGRLTS
jgi:hypothetical protein